MLSRRELLIDAVIAVAAFGLSLVLLAVGDSGEIDALVVLVAAVASLPLVARRSWPVSVFVVMTLASCVLHLIATPAGPPIGPTVALYGVAAGARDSRLGQPATLAVVAAMLAAHATAAGLAEGGFPASSLLFGAVLWGGVWLAGERSRLQRDRMRELEERAVRAEREAERERQLAAAEERTRIARDLHDSAGHAINVILVHAGLGRLRTERDPEGARQALETIEDVARETVGEIDQLVGVLREDAAPAREGAEVEPPPGLAALDGLLERHRAAGMEVTATIDGSRPPLAPGVDQGAYRILREALTNAARHGDGSARVRVAFGPGTLDLAVTNPVGRASGGRGEARHGVIGMRERAALLGGSLQAGAENGEFRVHARLPLGRPQ